MVAGMLAVGVLLLPAELEGGHPAYGQASSDAGELPDARLGGEEPHGMAQELPVLAAGDERAGNDPD
jgi:hypothetical protein